jgi:hypothetical protein
MSLSGAVCAADNLPKDSPGVGPTRSTAELKGDRLPVQERVEAAFVKASAGHMELGGHSVVAISDAPGTVRLIRIPVRVR